MDDNSASSDCLAETAIDAAAVLRERIEQKTATVGVIGLGYVGLPLASLFCERGFCVTGFDLDEKKIAQLRSGRSYIQHIPNSAIATLFTSGRFNATSDMARLADMDAILICVPTPLTKNREPDMSYVVSTGEAIAKHLCRGQVVILESSTYPGTTAGLLQPLLEKRGLKSGKDFFLAYSPEREDPGNIDHTTSVIPKVVGGDGPDALALAKALYDNVVKRTVPVSSLETAEAVKLTENIFRAVNIALMNELKTVFTPMGIDVWEVIEAAKTKPFGFMPFYPGPGLGGHCIPIDPFYLTWKAREFEVPTRFIELAGEINTRMPRYVVDRLAGALNSLSGRGLRDARILILGIAYKKNVDDMRESPALKIIELLEAQGAAVDYYDPFIPSIPSTRDHSALAGRCSIEWDPAALHNYDAFLICTDHDQVDYRSLAASERLIVDTRNACERAGIYNQNVVKA